MSAIRRLFGKFRSVPSAAKKSAEVTGASIEWVIAGLGNPGEEYARSRHNMGFFTIDRMAKAHGIELSRRKFKGQAAEIDIAGHPVMIVKPQTFYNLSGECISSLLGYFKVPPNRLIVIHDELDLEAGRIRVKQGGSDAGNRGVRSIAQSLSTPDFVRVRVGVGRPPGHEQGKDYVLKPMTRGEIEALGPILDRAADAAAAVMDDGLERAMNVYNQRV
ncbi:MAG TPA: aminoacyl-tRNA hydrolase [Candidatus Binataceae bacterium]|nr:aminoacyl-tRNA hydrolase [Candidatus Binataceae bacterium]